MNFQRNSHWGVTPLPAVRASPFHIGDLAHYQTPDGLWVTIRIEKEWCNFFQVSYRHLGNSSTEWIQKSKACPQGLMAPSSETLRPEMAVDAYNVSTKQWMRADVLEVKVDGCVLRSVDRRVHGFLSFVDNNIAPAGMFTSGALQEVSVMSSAGSRGVLWASEIENARRAVLEKREKERKKEEEREKVERERREKEKQEKLQKMKALDEEIQRLTSQQKAIVAKKKKALGEKRCLLGESCGSVSVQKKKDRNSEEDGEMECVVCLSGKRSFTLVPCGHFCLCGVCSKKKWQKCPLCRKSVEMVIQVYTS